MKILIPFVILVVLVVIVLPQVLFKVDETQYAVITRFGEIREVYTEPGLKVKAPFVDAVNYLDNRILRVDILPSEIPDVDAQFLEIDAYVRYRIVDAQRFFVSLRTEDNAQRILNNITVGALRGEIGQRTQVEIIGGQITTSPEGLPIVDPLLTEEGIPSRAVITRNVLERARADAQNQNLGVELLDARIKRADFPEEIAESVFERMRTERAILAQQLRAEGDEIFLTRTANVDRRVEVIRAEAQEQADTLRGQGQGEAIRILAAALEQDPELYAFLRSLETYENVLNENATLMLSPNSPLFQYLQDPSGAATTETASTP
ncbi:MAG: protease modulator HflC [Dehalococcoidia bacterium]